MVIITAEDARDAHIHSSRCISVRDRIETTQKQAHTHTRCTRPTRARDCYNDRAHGKRQLDCVAVCSRTFWFTTQHIKARSVVMTQAHAPCSDARIEHICGCMIMRSPRTRTQRKTRIACVCVCVFSAADRARRCVARPPRLMNNALRCWQSLSENSVVTGLPQQ